jgi:hypothetical protein
MSIDLHRLAIDALRAKGTPFAMELAAEIARGQERTYECSSTDRQQRNNREFMLGQVRPARPEEYAAWLRGYIKRGGRVTHFYSYPSHGRIWISKVPVLAVRPLYGCYHLRVVIIPHGSSEDGGDTGHTQLYFMDKYLSRGFHELAPCKPRFVPRFSDIKE